MTAPIDVPTNNPTFKRGGALAVFLGAVIAALSGFNLIHWTEAETSAVILEVLVTVALATSIIATLRPDTTKEPVAVTTALVAWCQATVALITVFDVITASQAGLLVGVISTGAVLLGVHVRDQVAPIGPNIDPDYVDAPEPTDRGLPPDA